MFQSNTAISETPSSQYGAATAAKMDPALKAKWVEALRSGEYQQGKTYLMDSKTNSYCCLGVLCVVGGVPVSNIRDRITTDTPGLESGLNDRTRSLLGDKMNDHEGKSFAEIADFIEVNL